MNKKQKRINTTDTTANASLVEVKCKKETKLEQLTKAMQLTNPDIMKLEMGCRMINKYGKKYIYAGVNSNRNGKRHLLHNCFMGFIPNEDGIQLAWSEKEIKENMEILGRDITPIDILKVIQNCAGCNGIAISGVGEFLKWNGINGGWDCTDVYYNFEKPLHQQEQETIEFLWDLIS